MANTKLLFLSKHRKDVTLETRSTESNEISISIENQSGYVNEVFLDKMTAVRLVRELKRQIGNLTNE